MSIHKMFGEKIPQVYRSVWEAFSSEIKSRCFMAYFPHMPIYSPFILLFMTNYLHGSIVLIVLIV